MLLKLINIVGNKKREIVNCGNLEKTREIEEVRF